MLAQRGHIELAIGEPARALAWFNESAARMQELDNPLFLPWCLEGLAGVAVHREQWELAARLVGSRDALRATVGPGVPPADPAGYERVLARLRSTLGDETFGAAHAAGESWPPAEAIAAATEALPGRL
jgi:hypothetical protein